MGRNRVGAGGMLVCRTCSHGISPTIEHICSHGPKGRCHWCERLRHHGRNKRNRRLHPRAKEMFKDGVSCYRIAKDLDIGYETVKRWFMRGKSPFNIVTRYQAPASPIVAGMQISAVEPASSPWGRW